MEESNKNNPNNPAPPKERAIKVRVICQHTLGPLLLKNGDVTDDEAYVALLKTKRGRTLVEKAA